MWIRKWWKKILLFGVVICGTQLFPFSKIAGLNQELLNSAISQGDQQKQTREKGLEASRVSKQNTEVLEATNLADPIVLVNKHRYLPEQYTPSDLIEPNIPFSFAGKSQKKLMRKEAALELEKLFKQAKMDHMNLVGVSAYRSYDSQNSIFKGNVREQGEDAASKVSALPGYSEHQTGLAIDVSTPKIGAALEPSFGNTDEGKWLAHNAPNYGFIIRYPMGKEQVTGYTYEPWHIRYVGKDAAQAISKNNLTLEEYLGNQ